MGKVWKPDSYPFTVSAEDYDLSRSFSREELLEDLQYMLDTFSAVHPNLFFSLSREALNDKLQKLRNSLSRPLTRLEFYKRIAPIAASFNDGHTKVSVPHEEYMKSDEIGDIRFPFGVDCSGKTVTLKGTSLDGYRSYLGRELLSINGEPVERILDEMLSMLTGERIEFKCSCIPVLFSKLLFVLRGGTEKYDLVVSGDSSPKTISVPGLSREQSRMASCVGHDKSTEPYSFNIIDDHDCVVLTLQSCDDIERFREFCANLFSFLDHNSIGKLLIDLRNNGGGSSDIGDELCAYLTDKPVFQFTAMEMKISRKIKKFYAGQFREKTKFPLNRLPLSILALLHPPLRKKPGEVYRFEVPQQKPLDRSPRYDGLVFVITSQFTYSAAASLATMLKTHNLGSLIGEPTGGNASTYGDTFSFSLPNTKLTCGVSHKFFIGPDGSRKPEPTTPDLDTRDYGIDLNCPEAIRDILNLIKRNESNKAISTEPQHEPDACQ